MTEVIETLAYEAVLVGKNSEEQVKTFARLTEAILWVSAECNAGNVQQGMVRLNGAVLWRKRTFVLPSSPPLAPDSPEAAASDIEADKVDSSPTSAAQE